MKVIIKVKQLETGECNISLNKLAQHDIEIRWIRSNQITQTDWNPIGTVDKIMAVRYFCFPD